MSWLEKHLKENKNNNLETFEDPGGPYGTECARTYHDLPSWIEP